MRAHPMQDFSRGIGDRCENEVERKRRSRTECRVEPGERAFWVGADAGLRFCVRFKSGT